MSETGHQGYFTGLEARHRRRVLLWGGLVLTVVAAAVAFALLRLPAEDRGQAPKKQAPESTSTPEATATPGGGSSSATSGVTPGGGGSGSGGSGGPPAPDNGGGSKAAASAGWVAYVLDDGVWISKCDGVGARRVAGTEALLGYAVSPDGATLALARSDGLQLLDVATGKARPVTTGAAGGLSWSADSKRLAFSASAKSPAEWAVKVCGRDGTGLVTIGSGALPKISRDGKRVAFMTAAASAGVPLAVAPVTGGRTTTIPGTRGALDFAWAADDALYVILPGKVTTGQTPASMAIKRVTLSGGTEQVFSSAISAPIVTWMYLYASPDAKSLVFAEVGDDGYSRAHVLRIGGKLVDLSVRRDTRPVGWTADGRVLFVEGNAFQGEGTDIVCANADGTGRRIVAEDASY